MKQLGYLILWRIADLAAPYTDLQALATTAGFPSTCLPTPPSAYNAWQKATSLRRQKLIPPQPLVEEIQAEYSCQPIVQAESKVVNERTRHILRLITVPGARSKNSQVDVEPVATLTFDENGLSDMEKFLSSYPHDDPLQAVNGNVDCLIHRMKLEYERQLTTADGQDIRAGVRKYLDTLGATGLSDGTYFTPGITGLEALQKYILGLAPYRRGDGVITCQVYPVIDDNSPLSEQNRVEIAAAAAAHFRQELERVLTQSQPDGRGTEASKARLKRAGETLGQVEAKIGEYETGLGELGLGELAERCWGAIRKAKETLENV
jgi:hypothetical protein